MASKTKVVSIAKRKKPVNEPIPTKKSKHKAVFDRSRYISLWKDFADHTTLDGLHLLSIKNVPVNIKIAVIIFWFITLSLASVLCIKKIEIYFNYDVRTTISTKPVRVQQFPAISFCNAYFLKRSIIGLSDDSIVLLTKLYSRNNFEAMKLVEQNRRTCKFNYSETDEIRKKIENVHSFYYKSDLGSIIENGTIDSTMSVMKCWWKNVETNCNQHFLNHVVDGRSCFTFNQERNTIAAVSGTVNVYGPSEYEMQNLEELNTGKATGLKLLINVNQNESCGSFGTRFGAGFFTVVHDQMSAISLQLQSTISLGPGFEYDISLQPTNYDMRNFSESMGKCTSKVYNFLDPTSDYNREACIQACLTEVIWFTCNCMPLQKDSLSQSILQYMGSHSVKFCDFLSINDFLCSSSIASRFQTLNLDVLCPKCKRKCLETKYDYMISMKKLSLPSVQRLISSSIHTNESIEKNFLLVSFYFRSMDLVSVKETQKVTVLDLLMDISNILGLFLGFSVVTVPEVFFYICLMITMFCKHLFQKLLN